MVSAGAVTEEVHPFLESNDNDEPSVELSSLDSISRSERTPDVHYMHPPRASTEARVSPRLVTLALVGTILGFVVNTEATEYFQSILGWKKPFATLYITHSSLAIPWLVYVVCYDRYRSHHMPSTNWLQSHLNALRATISTIDAYTMPSHHRILKFRTQPSGPLHYLATAMSLVFAMLTTTGVAWFLSLALTTPADLTAIYNSSTFFAAAFSVPLLNERLGWRSISAVAIAVVGTVVIAYGDSAGNPPIEVEGDTAAPVVGASRVLGNIIAAVGALAFGLYEVLLKKFACSSRPVGPEQSLPLALTASALLGLYTFVTLWFGLVVLHFVGIETFVWPSLKVWIWIMIAVAGGCGSLTLLTVLVVWTDPVFGSFANVLSVFFIAIADWFIFGLLPSPATYAGGGLVVVAFCLLTWDTFFKH